MQITLATQPFAALETEALVSYVFEETDAVQGRIAELDQAAAGLLRKLAKSGELTGKMLEFTLIHAPAGLKAARLFLVGAGKREQWNSATLRKIAGAALRFLKARSVKNFALLVREGNATEETAQAIAEGALTANFESDKYKTDRKNDKNIESVLVAGFSNAERAAGDKGLSKGRIIADAQNFARDLVNEPSNKLTPRILAEKAEAMAKGAGLAVEILDEKKIADLKMGALLSVAQAGPEPPRVMVVTYTPANPKPGAPVIGLVGKAVTFDTGGISIKPSEGMEKMKYDMAGGATMLGVMRALAALKPSVKVICVVPSTENMPGGKAQNPWAKKCGKCPSTTTTAISSREPSPISRTSAAAKAAAPSPVPCSSRNSPATPPGFTWTSPALPGTTTPSLGLPKAPPAWPCAPSSTLSCLIDRRAGIVTVGARYIVPLFLFSYSRSATSSPVPQSPTIPAPAPTAPPPIPSAATETLASAHPLPTRCGACDKNY